MASRTLHWVSKYCQNVPPMRPICLYSNRPSLFISTPFRRLSSTAREPDPWQHRLIPILLRPSFWKSMTPKPFRKEARMKRKEENRDKRWNPATYFIMIFLLIGSFSIHFITLRQSYAMSSRQADNRISMLQEVLRRVQAGEDVDVEKMLGTGDPLAEQEWEEVIKYIEEEDRQWKSKEAKLARKKARKEAKRIAEAAAAAENPAKASSDPFAKPTQEFAESGEMLPKKKRTPGFY